MHCSEVNVFRLCIFPLKWHSQCAFSLRPLTVNINGHRENALMNWNRTLETVTGVGRRLHHNALISLGLRYNKVQLYLSFLNLWPMLVIEARICFCSFLVVAWPGGSVCDIIATSFICSSISQGTLPWRPIFGSKLRILPTPLSNHCTSIPKRIAEFQLQF